MTDHEGPGDAAKGERDDRPEIDIDTAFAAIIADFAAPVPHGVGPWPAIEDLDEDDESGDGDPSAVRAVPGDDDAAADDARAGTASPDRWDPPVRRISIPGDRAAAPEGPRAGDVHDDLDDDGFVPPEPPPFPRGDLVSRVAWAAVIGGPAFLLVAALAWRSLPTILLLAA
jgi:hypothetical protein